MESFCHLQDLPWEIIMKVLMFLPVEALVCLMCVSKFWYSFIASREFINHHFQASYNGGNKFLLSGPNIICGNPLKRFKSLLYMNPLDISCMKKIPCQIDSNCCQIVSSCAGLVCLTDPDRYGVIIHLWNPFIRKSLKITSSSIGVENFTFDDFTQLVLGFGYIFETNEHKIVRIVYVEEPDDEEEEDDFFHARNMIAAHNPGQVVISSYFLDASTSVASQNVTHVEVFSLKTNTWREIKAPNVALWYLCDSFSRAFLNNCVHWRAFRKDDTMDAPVILSFDFLNEVFGEVKLPDQYNFQVSVINEVTVYNGKLSFLTAENLYTTDQQRCSFFIMDEYGNQSSWSTVFNVVLNGIIHVPTMITVEDEIAYVKSNVDEGTIELYLHNFRSNETRAFGKNLMEGADNLDFLPMMSSLIMLDPKNEFMEIDEEKL
ncbi:OLC1v1024768C1 [Oldenlandia corymbosa var. corymbosa]|uniref:OLC1v1024768C1 n=1 Tax=Oldenlandia corymbosa var. corymbosa TaxID=529605 RepID=A0AAV1C4I0_OLDCO|nr:OLC1v1024768C1 [Oldenlandia corymbosa var. corymbosa]